MRSGLLLFTAIAAPLWAAGCIDTPTLVPCYTSESIVNAASSQRSMAPGTLVSVYGTNLSFDTDYVRAGNIHNGLLPTQLAGTHVLVNNVPAALYYVSPVQINFLVSTSKVAGVSDVQVVNEGRAGPVVHITLGESAPALFLGDPQFAVGTRRDGSVVTKDNPVHPGDVVVVYATGLGHTRPSFEETEIPNQGALLTRYSEFRVRLDGRELDSFGVFYAGVTPGFSGLYQVNIRLPESIGDDPEIRIGFNSAEISPEGIRLPLRNAQ